MDVADFAAEYKTKADEELLSIHYDAAELTDDARVALSAELKARGLDRPDTVAGFRKQELQRREDESLARPTIFDRRKVIGSRFGKSNYEYDSETGTETFTTTLFFVLSGLPLIPIGTYRVEKKKGFRYDYRILERVPLDWQQVLSWWSVTAIGLLLTILMFRLFVMRAHN